MDLRLTSNGTVTTQSKSGIVIADYNHTEGCTVTNTGHGTMQVRTSRTQALTRLSFSCVHRSGVCSTDCT